MLANLDVVLSFAVIMLGVSMMVMVLTQTLSALLNLRGARLRAGLEELFKQAGLDEAERTSLATAILLHPLLSDGVVWRRLAPAIRKEELVRLMDTMKQSRDFETIKEKLEQATATIEQWFNSAMDRVSHKFAGSMRGITIVFSFIVAFALHLDTIQLLGQLSTSAELRESLIARSESLRKRAEASFSAPASVEVVPANATSDQDIGALIAATKDIRKDLEEGQFQVIPTPYPGLNFAGHFWGIVASAVLLSLGAPFWFNVLRTASTLRPTLAMKVEESESKGGTRG